MTKKATRSAKYSEAASILYLAFELSSTKWKLGFSVGLGQRARERSIPANDREKLEREITEAKKRFKLPAGAEVLSCYEAGRDGFWLHRYLTERGVENLVVDSSSIEVNRRARRAKADGLDVQKLLTMLIRYHLGERKVWSVVTVPSAEEEDGRHLHRELRTLNREMTRVKNRIRGLLTTQGVRLKSEIDLSGERLDSIRQWDGSTLRAGLKERLRREWEHLELLKRQVLLLKGNRRKALKEADESVDLEKVNQLRSLKGIGDNGSWLLVREFFGWRKFNNRREVGSIAGLTPTPYQSGEENHEQGISKSGNRHVRGIAIELAWSWLRYQPDSKLSRWYERRFAKGGKRARRLGVVAVARRLLIDMWRYVEFGVLPEGALLKG